jgi:hypothetical protein
MSRQETPRRGEEICHHYEGCYFPRSERGAMASSSPPQDILEATLGPHVHFQLPRSAFQAFSEGCKLNSIFVSVEFLRTHSICGNSIPSTRFPVLSATGRSQITTPLASGEFQAPQLQKDAVLSKLQDEVG